MSCCGGCCCCGAGCGCGVTYNGLEEKNTSTSGTLVLGASQEKGSIKASEKVAESGEAGHGCSCGSSCGCSPCSC
ncbi:hypothetical protein ACP4OV_022827 [Aristida adscensionis]